MEHEYVIWKMFISFSKIYTGLSRHIMNLAR